MCVARDLHALYIHVACRMYMYIRGKYIFSNRICTPVFLQCYMLLSYMYKSRSSSLTNTSAPPVNSLCPRTFLVIVGEYKGQVYTV